MRWLASLATSRSGATVTEFAFVAPALLMMIMGLVDGSRMFWTRQVLSEVAFSTARCMSVGTACNTTTLQKSYAVARARSYGVRVIAANVTPTTNSVCRGQAGSNSITVSTPFVSSLRGFLPMPRTLSATVCFPFLS